MNETCPVCGCDINKCICDDGCDSCGAQMVEIQEPGALDYADRVDTKKLENKDNKFQMPKAYGDKYVRQVANLVIGKNPIFKIG